MSIEIIVVLISGGISLFVAFLTLSINRYLTMKQLEQDRLKFELERQKFEQDRLKLQQEYQKQLYDLKSVTLPELYRSRLAAYIKLNNILNNFSRPNIGKLSSETSRRLGEQINDWMYSEGGLVQASKSREITWLLRDYCLNWKEGVSNPFITSAKDYLQREMRNDLDVSTLGYDTGSSLSVYIKEEIEKMAKEK